MNVLGWGNSALNPFVYAFYSPDFRRSFRRILCCQFKKKYPYGVATYGALLPAIRFTKAPLIPNMNDTPNGPNIGDILGLQERGNVETFNLRMKKDGSHQSTLNTGVTPVTSFDLLPRPEVLSKSSSLPTINKQNDKIEGPTLLKASLMNNNLARKSFSHITSLAEVEINNISQV